MQKFCNRIHISKLCSHTQATWGWASRTWRTLTTVWAAAATPRHRTHRSSASLTSPSAPPSSQPSPSPSTWSSSTPPTVRRHQVENLAQLSSRVKYLLSALTSARAGDRLDYFYHLNLAKKVVYLFSFQGTTMLNVNQLTFITACASCFRNFATEFLCEWSPGKWQLLSAAQWNCTEVGCLKTVTNQPDNYATQHLHESGGRGGVSVRQLAGPWEHRDKVLSSHVHRSDNWCTCSPSFFIFWGKSPKLCKFLLNFCQIWKAQTD